MSTEKLLKLHELNARNHEQARDALVNLGRLEGQDSIPEEMVKDSHSALVDIALELDDRGVDIVDAKENRDISFED